MIWLFHNRRNCIYCNWQRLVSRKVLASAEDSSGGRGGIVHSPKKLHQKSWEEDTFQKVSLSKPSLYLHCNPLPLSVDLGTLYAWLLLSILSYSLSASYLLLLLFAFLLSAFTSVLCLSTFCLCLLPLLSASVFCFSALCLCFLPLLSASDFCLTFYILTTDARFSLVNSNAWHPFFQFPCSFDL